MSPRLSLARIDAEKAAGHWQKEQSQRVNGHFASLSVQEQLLAKQRAELEAKTRLDAGPCSTYRGLAGVRGKGDGHEDKEENGGTHGEDSRTQHRALLCHGRVRPATFRTPSCESAQI